MPRGGGDPESGWPSWSRIWFEVRPTNLSEGDFHDDHRHYRIDRARREGSRHRRAAPDGAVHGPAADGARRRGALRRRLRREERRAAEQQERLPRPNLGHPRRQRRAEDPQAAPGQLLPRVPRATAHRREGPHGRDPGSLCPGHLDPFGRRPGQGARHERGVQEPGEPAMRRTRRARRRLPEPTDRGRLAVPVDRRHLRQDTRGWTHRQRGGDSGGGRQYRRPSARCWA